MFTFVLCFQTTDGNGLLLYSSGVTGDYMALELYDGSLFFVLDDGNGPRTYLIKENMNDDVWHNIEIVQVYEGNSIYFALAVDVHFRYSVCSCVNFL